MSRRFHLPPPQSKHQCTPVWIPILIGIVIGLGLGLLLNMMGLMRCCNYSADQATTGIQESSAQVVQRELLSISSTPEEESDATALEAGTEAAVAESVSVKEPIEPEVVQDSTTRDPSKQIRLQVLNGCGKRGIAREVAPALRRLGFDVRENGNAKHYRHQQTRIYDRSGNMNLAYEVADAVGIDSSLVEELIDKELVDIDVTIVIGADYKALHLGLNE